MSARREEYTQAVFVMCMVPSSVGGVVDYWLALRIEWSGLEPWPGSMCWFLGKTLNSHSASLHPWASLGVSMVSIAEAARSIATPLDVMLVHRR